jgi:hypothetical protein
VNAFEHAADILADGRWIRLPRPPRGCNPQAAELAEEICDLLNDAHRTLPAEAFADLVAEVSGP